MDFFSYPSTTLYTLSECLLKADYLDFREHFRVTACGLVAPLKRYFYSPEETVVRHRFRMENQNDVRGHSFFYLLETTEGRRGYLIEEQNGYTDSLTTFFINEIPDNKPLVPGVFKRPVTWLRSIGNLFL